MRYLIVTHDGNTPFFTNNFTPENHFSAEIGMTVCDLVKGLYTTDGVNWEEIEEDHL